MKPGIFSSLKREQKEAVGLLSIGTFLEYFDLMLYIHMAVVLNDLFFPKTDPHTTSLLAAFAFCSTYLLRPFGALIFGWIGDHIGRKTTVVITTILMSISCFVMANLPTYAQVGMTAAWLVTICRIVQGLSSMGEITGAQLYLSETISPPASYPTVGILAMMASLGGTMALVVGHLSISIGFNWRYAFWFGALIAIVGGIARVRLRETRDFADAKHRIQSTLEKLGRAPNLLKESSFYNEKVNKKTILYLLGLDCMWPVCFYFSYIHCSGILTNSFHFTSEQLIYNNLIVSLAVVFGDIVFIVLSRIIHPLKILKVKLFLCSCIILSIPYYLNTVSTAFGILILQCSFLFFACDAAPSMSVFYKYFPVFKRFTYMSFTYALSRALVYVLNSVAIIYLTQYFGHWGLLVIMFPVILAFKFGLDYFDKLEKESENQPLQKEPLELVAERRVEGVQ